MLQLATIGLLTVIFHASAFQFSVSDFIILKSYIGAIAGSFKYGICDARLSVIESGLR